MTFIDYTGKLFTSDAWVNAYFILKIFVRMFELFAFIAVSAVYQPVLFERVMRVFRRKHHVKELEEELKHAHEIEDDKIKKPD